jgi:peptide/nickel transport system substrate-binding protein
MTTRADHRNLSRSGFLKVAGGTVATASLVGAPALLRTATASASAPHVPKRGGILTASVNEEIKILDAYTSEINLWRTIRENVFDTLIYDDLEHLPLSLKPRLATSWRYTDPTTFELTLRTGVRFHDRSSFDAEDVKFSLDRLLTLSSFIGASLGPVSTVIVVDPTHVQIKMRAPFAGLPVGLAHVCIYSKHATQTTFTQQPIGTGPFRFAEFRRAAYTKLTRFEGYWEPGVPYLDEIVLPVIIEDVSRLAALQSGQTDMLLGLSQVDAPLLMTNPSITVLRNLVRSATDVLYLNLFQKPLDNPLARQALSHLIDRKTYYKVILNGFGGAGCSPFIPQNWAYYPKEGDVSRWPYDLAAAKDLLGKAGYPNGKGFHLVFALVADFPEQLEGAQLLQSAVAQVGGSMDFLTQEVPAWIDTIEKNFNYTLSSDTSSRAEADPATTLSDQFMFGPNSIIGRWHNPTVTKILAEGASKFTIADRRPYYWQYQTIWNQHLYGMILGQRDLLSAATHRVHGFVENCENYRNFRYTYIS